MRALHVSPVRLFLGVGTVSGLGSICSRLSGVLKGRIRLLPLVCDLLWDMRCWLYFIRLRDERVTISNAKVVFFLGHFDDFASIGSKNYRILGVIRTILGSMSSRVTLGHLGQISE